MKLYRVLAAMALAYCVVASPVSAHPNYPGLGGPKQKDAVVMTVQGGKNALAIAARYIGTNPTGWKRLWCARWLNMVERKAGRAGTGSAAARSFAKYGRGISLAHAKPGDIVVLGRKGGGHVGYYLSHNGKSVRIRSGNTSGRRGARIVADGNYPVTRIIAVRRPA